MWQAESGPRPEKSRRGQPRRLVQRGASSVTRRSEGKFLSAATPCLSMTALRANCATQSRRNHGVARQRDAISVALPTGMSHRARVSASEKGRKYLGGKGNFAVTPCHLRRLRSQL